MAAQRSSVQCSPVPLISHSVAQECTALDMTFIRILRFASLHLLCFPLVFCFALLLLMQLCYLCGIVSFFVAAFDACLLLLAWLLLLLLLPVARSHLLLLLLLLLSAN